MAASTTSTRVFSNDEQIRTLLDQSVTRYFYDTLPDQSGMVVAEYVWIGGHGHDMRSKSKTLTAVPKGVEDLPVWNYDGSSTGTPPLPTASNRRLAFDFPRAISSSSLELCCAVTLLRMYAVQPAGHSAAPVPARLPARNTICIATSGYA